MDPQSCAAERFGFIEGARGLAAIQVVLLHYFSAFLPAFARVGTVQHYGWEIKLSTTPAFFVINGNAAVFIFFLMSGFVLAPSFMNARLGIGRQVLKRFVRLFIPVAVSVIVAIALVCLIPRANEHAASFTHSTWAANLYANPMTLASLAKEVLLNSMMLGYQAASIFEHVSAIMRFFPLQPLTESLNPPLWTLHAEFWGSMLTLAVAQLYRRISRPLFWAIFAVTFILTGTSPFTLFLLGFAGYTCRHRMLQRTGRITSFLGAVLIAGGVVVSSSIGPGWFDSLLMYASRYTWMQAAAGVRVQNEIAAVLLLAGVVINPAARRLLAHQVPVWLGKISFSVYLIHFPILFTVGYGTFLLVAPHVPYATSVLIATATGSALTISIAALFERVVDRRAVMLARWAVDWRRLGANVQTAR